MFFDKDNLNLDYIETLGFKQESMVSKVPTRNFCAISIRVKTENTRFYYEKGKISVKDGDILFVPPLAYTRTSDYDEVYCLHFRVSGVNFDEIEKFTPKNPQVFIELFRKIFNRTRDMNTHYEGAQGLYEILSLIKSERGAQVKSKDYLRIKRALDLISVRYGDGELSVPTLARECNLSESRFRQLFEKETGVSPRKYITSVRLRHATALLREGGFKMSEIAERVGFCDEKYLSAVFSKNTGLSPREIKTVNKTNFEGIM